MGNAQDHAARDGAAQDRAGAPMYSVCFLFFVVLPATRERPAICTMKYFARWDDLLGGRLLFPPPSALGVRFLLEWWVGGQVNGG